MPAPGRSRGLFVTVEGGEGAGKGSVLAALAQVLQSGGRDVLVTREPGGSREGAAIRSLIVRSDHEWTPLGELMLLMADRAEHVARLIRPALEEGRTVLCDRFEASTYAYQGAGKQIDSGLIGRLQAMVAPGLTPDLTILLDVAPELGLARSLRRLAHEDSGEDRFEKLGTAFHARVRQSFLDQAQAAAHRWIVVDAQLPLEAMIKAAASSLEQRLAHMRPAD